MDTFKNVATDYVGFQVGSSIVNMRPEFKDSALKVTINSALYRAIIRGRLPQQFLDFFNKMEDKYFKEMLIDFIVLGVMNLISMNVIGDKKSYGTTVIKSAIQSFVSSWSHSMIK